LWRRVLHVQFPKCPHPNDPRWWYPFHPLPCVYFVISNCNSQRNITYKACQIPILLFRNFVVTSAASCGIRVTRPTTHFRTVLGANQTRLFAAMLAFLGKSGMRNRVLIFTPLGLWAICVTVGKRSIPDLIFRGEELFRRRWMISRSM
jgi:hypothetical protein